MQAAAWQYWQDLGDGLIGAFVLLVTGDPETWSVIRQSLLISLSATVPSVLVGVPMGIWMALTPFRGRTALLTACNVGYGLPPVVVGLIMSILLLRHGPLGFLNLRFTPTAMVIAQFILSCPIMINLTVAAVQQLHPKLGLQMQALGASQWQLLWLFARETRLPLLAAYMAAFGSIISEVGASVMVGGNLPGSTRVLTTAIVMETGMGHYDRAMATVPGVVDLSVEQQIEIPTLSVRFDRSALARFGVMIEDMAHALEAALQGVTVSRVLEGRHAVALVVRLSDGADWTPETLGALLVDTPGGAKIPLQRLAQVTKTTGPNTISREQVERKIVVMCNVAGRDVASVVREIAQRVDPLIAAKPGYSVAYGGQFESAEEAGRLLSLLGLAVILSMAFLLYLAFGSARDAALVMVNLPLALMGGIAGVFLSGGVLSVASLIGFITVFGIATRNGIMLVSHIRHLQAHEGVTTFYAAVFRGAMERLAPILMTALAAGLALLPLALSGDKPGNEIQTPMAIVILCGLLTSMVLNMLIVPALYLRFGRPVQRPPVPSPSGSAVLDQTAADR